VWLAPTSDKWAADTEFQTDCVLFTAFHHNNISGASGGNPNHWIAFTEDQVRASTSFRSHFLSDFLKDKILSSPAQKLYDSVKALFIYYHKVRDKSRSSVDAGLYDIKEYFCGRNEKGHLRSKSDDATYTALIADYKQCLDALGTSIAAKVHEYGFMD
jgi:hypothetical protein